MTSQKDTGGQRDVPFGGGCREGAAVQGRRHWRGQGPVASVLGRKTLAGSPGKRLPETE